MGAGGCRDGCQADTGMGAGWCMGLVLGPRRGGCWAVQGWVSGWCGDGCWASTGSVNPVKPVGQVWGRGWHGGAEGGGGNHGQTQIPPGCVSGSGERAGQQQVPWRGQAERCRRVLAELRARHGLRLFVLERSCCYEALLLDEERGRLFAGAQNHLLSLALDDISQRDRKVMGGPQLPGGPWHTPGLRAVSVPLSPRRSTGRHRWSGGRSATGLARTSP